MDNSALSKINQDTHIEIMRVLATFLVVIGHSTFYSITTEVSDMGVSWNIFDSTMIGTVLAFIVNIIYSCHMQFFMFISGMVYQLSVQKGKYKELVSFVKRKAARLLLPYALVSVLWNIPIYLWARYFGESNIIRNMILYFIGFGKNHLWFLCALFLIFLTTKVIENIGGRYITLLLVSVAAFLYGKLVDGQWIHFMYLDRLSLYWVWFVIGMIAYNKKNFIHRVCDKFSPVFMVISFLLLWAVAYWILHNTKAAVLIAAPGIGFLYFFCRWFDQYQKVVTSQFFKLVDSYSLEIYLYGTPVNYILIETLIRICGSNIELSNAGSLLLFVTRVILQIVVSIVVAYFAAYLIGKLKQIWRISND